MNKDNLFFKIFSIIAFVAFMLVSCWATVESLQMSLPWPKVAFWVVTIGLFVISSLGAKLIVDSFNMHKRFAGSRGWRLVGGIIVMLLFWVLFSIPTNTHTFFYNNKSEAVIMKDIRRTKMYLQQISNENTQQVIKVAQDDFKNAVWAKYESFESEYDNPANPGYGPEATQRLKELNDVLKEYSVEEPLVRLSGNHNDKQVRNSVKRQYRNLVEARLKTACDAIEQKIILEKGIATQNAEEVLKKLESIGKEIDAFKMRDTIMSPRDMKKKALPAIRDGYEVIANNHELISFANNYDKILYSGQTDRKGKVVKNEEGKVSAKECESARLFNVFSIWQDYFKGQYKGMGFFYWILVAILVDIAGFIFFSIAFKNL